MDRAVVELKLETLRRCVARVESKTGVPVAEFLVDLDRQDVVSLNLERAVQACVDIASHILSSTEAGVPGSMGETMEALVKEGLLSDAVAQRIRKAIAFRNIAVHEYRALDWAIVHSLATHHLDDFRNFAREVTRWMERADEGR